MRMINLWRKSRFSESHANSLANSRAKAIYAIAFTMLAVFSLASCSSDPEWADPEAHEKTERLREQYGPLLVGTWYFERIGERQRFFERLTFESDGTLTGLRKWQIRRLVTVDGKETLTDWEDIPEEADGEHQSSGTFIGTWKLYWERNDGMNHLSLYAGWQDGEYTAFSEDAIFGSADTETLRIRGRSFIHLSPEEDDGEHQSSDWITYRRGEAKPDF